MTWFVAQVQYHNPECSSTGKKSQGDAWGLAYVSAGSEAAAVQAIQNSKACTVRGFSVGPETKVYIHTVEDLDDSMESRDLTPKRRRVRK